MFARPPAIAPFGVVGVLFCDGTDPGSGPLWSELESLVVRLDRPGGAPCLDNEKAFILACMSDDRPLALGGGGPGRRAAFSGPRGAEEAVMVFGELSKEVRSDGGLGEVVAGGSAGADVGGLEGLVGALSILLGSCAGRTRGLSCVGSSIVPDSAVCLCLLTEELVM